MKPLRKKRAITLYEKRLSVGFVVTTLVCYVLAALIWYVLGVITPYMDYVGVSEADNAFITRKALSATAEEIAASCEDKERATLLPTSAQSFLLHLRMVEDARETIDFMVYDSFEEDYSSYFYTALVRAADRGVKVRIILDGKIGRLSGTLKTMEGIVASNANIELYYFNPFNIWRPAGLMVLMHDKVSIFDGKMMTVGGVNLGNSWFLRNADMEVLITNSGENGGTSQATAYFERMINSGLCKRKTAKSRNEQAKAEYVRQYEEFYEDSEIAAAEVNYAEMGVPIDKCTFISNQITDGKKAPIILRALYNLAEGAESANLVTPYTLLTDDKLYKLRELAGDGRRVKFRLITNSLYNTRNVAFAVYYYDRQKLIADGIELWEYQAESQLHAKFSTFDNRYSVIGSFNLDERSAHIDTEAVVVIDSPQFAAIVNDYIDYKFISNSLKVGQDNVYEPSNNGVTAGDVPRSKAFLYTIYNSLRCVINLI